MAEESAVEWQPTCDQTGCIGIPLPSGAMCLAHASEDQAAAALDRIARTGEIDARGVPLTPDLLAWLLSAAARDKSEQLVEVGRFDRATFIGGASFYGVTFGNPAAFRLATFEAAADFNHAIFTGGAEFDGATFGGDARFNVANFKRAADFPKVVFKGGRTEFNIATFTGSADFREAVLSGEAEFEGAVFGADAVFEQATFGYAVFGGTTFKRGARFERATFEGRAEFDGATVRDGSANFAKTTFNYGAWLGATFEGDAQFSEATFSGDDNRFTGATFAGRADFGETTFNRRAGFDQVTFRGDAEFGKATFGSDVEFSGTIFKRGAGFTGARFEQVRRFGPVLAHHGLVLDDARFAQSIRIEASSPLLCCRGARFDGGVQFRLRWARVTLDDTDLAAPSIVTGISRLSGADLADQEGRIAPAWRRLTGNMVSERPQLLSLRRADVAGLGLSNVSAAECRFAGAYHLDKLRLESGVGFATAPAPANRGPWRWGGREVIAEERAWRASRSRRWVAPGWPAGLGDPPEALDPRQIAGLYRALRKGREDIKDEPGAADFYYGEMEMRRARPGNRPGGRVPGAVERGILTAYWLVSGYGLRAWRAVLALAMVTALLAIAFHLVGFAVPPRPVSYWTSLLFTLRATLSLTDDQVKLTAWGKLLQAFLRLVGPVLLGLALLALRGRVKR